MDDNKKKGATKRPTHFPAQREQGTDFYDTPAPVTTGRKRTRQMEDANAVALPLKKRTKTGGGTVAPVPQGRPSFEKDMKPSHVTKGFLMRLPSEYKEWMPEEDMVFTLFDEQRRGWKINYIAEQHAFSGGWKDFAVGHNLKVTDTVLFDPIDNLSFNTSIKRSSGGVGAAGNTDSLIGNMSFKLPATSDVRRNARAKLKQQVSTGPISVENVTSPTLSVPSQKHQRVEEELEVGFKTLKISESGNVFVDPSSIDSYVASLSTESEDKYLHDLGAAHIADTTVTESYRVLLESLALRRFIKFYQDRVKSLKKTTGDVQKEKEVLVEEVNSLKGRVTQAELELSKEKETSQRLVNELNNIATNCSVKARGEVMLEYQRGRMDKWEVQGDIELFRGYYPQEYEEMVKQLDSEGLTGDQEGHSKSDDKSKPVEEDQN